ncbi:hypothetical protein TPHA_0E00290 [Tetrapisispora phaffii CBS 4417]|uniref:Uncharacterized protein n=1 Tax=Tetrapisispora phaffii (strain ATCC 24235 / CBS 4417 / NBRC 1672 / NRRL Y-8282 / UCD 70-5) TaxID=1071381 RepID=G8BT97_TETPH|nr:hypothetical protein TPHA_0E00290 [Tetrapisispora phaffii CBS 4417]CCE63125.1 hypothetical protein TPHA_0E00290 [Tetrapisispora phaffii CBS 4417]
MEESLLYDKERTSSPSEKTLLDATKMEITTPPKVRFPKITTTSSPEDNIKDNTGNSPKLQVDSRRAGLDNNTLSSLGISVRRSSRSSNFDSSPIGTQNREVSDEFEMNSGHLDVGSNNTDSSKTNAFSIPQSPSSKTKLLPPTTPKSRHNEMFLSPSSPKLKSPGVYKEHDKPIREISNTLKTRLNYALVKLQNGWTEKTFSQLEKEVDREKNPLHSDDTIKLEAQRRLSVYNNIYANDNSDSDGNSEEDSNIARFSIENHKNAKLENKDYIKGLSSNSAHTAFLKAISSPKKSNHANDKYPVSPLKWNQREGSPTKETSPVPEDEAIETLMSLSSPKKSHSKAFEMINNNKKPVLSNRESSDKKDHSAFKPLNVINNSNNISRDSKSQTEVGNDSTDIEMEFDDVQTDIEDPETSVDT